MDCQDSLLVSNMSLMLHVVVFWEQRKGWRRGETRGSECGTALWQQQILELLSLGAATDVTQPIGTFFYLSIVKRISASDMPKLPLKLRKLKPPTFLLPLRACYPRPAPEPLRKWHTVAIAHSSPLQVSDGAELRPQLQNTVWCWWCGDVVLVMNSIRARVKMQGVQLCIPRRSQCSQQLGAVDSVPFASEGPLTLSVLVSICSPRQGKWWRQRMLPRASADLGEGEQNLEDGDDLVWWRGCLCSQQGQMKGGTGRIWGQAAVKC